MNSSMQKYKKRMLILCIMLAVVLMITGVSYAVFTGYSSQTDANTLAASCMDLEFNGQNEINLLNTYPISEGEALEQTPYTFTIKNKCDNYIEYYVIASVISTTNKVDSKYVKVSLLGDNDLNGTVINTLESISTPQSLSKYNITENYILKRGDGISKDESRTFNFRMWLDSSNKDIWTREDIEGNREEGLKALKQIKQSINAEREKYELLPSMYEKQMMAGISLDIDYSIDEIQRQYGSKTEIQGKPSKSIEILEQSSSLDSTTFEAIFKTKQYPAEQGKQLSLDEAKAYLDLQEVKKAFSEIQEKRIL